MYLSQLAQVIMSGLTAFNIHPPSQFRLCIDNAMFVVIDSTLEASITNGESTKGNNNRRNRCNRKFEHV